MKKRLDAIEAFDDRAKFMLRKGYLKSCFRAYSLRNYTIDEAMQMNPKLADSDEYLPLVVEFAEKEKFSILIVRIIQKINRIKKKFKP